METLLSKVFPGSIVMYKGQVYHYLRYNDKRTAQLRGTDGKILKIPMEMKVTVLEEPKWVKTFRGF